MQRVYTGSGVFSLIKELRAACLRWHEGHARVRAVGQALFIWEGCPVTTRHFSLWGCSLGGGTTGAWFWQQGAHSRADS